MTSQTAFFLVKTVLSGLVIAAISEAAKTFPKGAALLTALPMMTFLSLIWIYFEKRDLNLLAVYTKDVILWVIPSFAFFIAAYFLFKHKVPFVVSMALATVALGIGVWVFEKAGFLK
jgi:uncharacterized membrane protein (GlpM family)